MGRCPGAVRHGFIEPPKRNSGPRRRPRGPAPRRSARIHRFAAAGHHLQRVPGAGSLWRGFLILVAQYLQDRVWTFEYKDGALALFYVAVEVRHLGCEEAVSLRANLVRGSVIDAECTGPAAHVSPRDFHEMGCWKIRCPMAPARKRLLGGPPAIAARKRRWLIPTSCASSTITKSNGERPAFTKWVAKRPYTDGRVTHPYSCSRAWTCASGCQRGGTQHLAARSGPAWQSTVPSRCQARDCR